MATAIPRGAQPHLAALSEHLRQFEEDHVQGFGLPVLSTDLRDLASAAMRAADAIMDAYTRALAATKEREVAP